MNLSAVLPAVKSTHHSVVLWGRRDAGVPSLPRLFLILRVLIGDLRRVWRAALSGARSLSYFLPFGAPPPPLAKAHLELEVLSRRTKEGRLVASDSRESPHASHALGLVSFPSDLLRSSVVHNPTSRHTPDPATFIRAQPGQTAIAYLYRAGLRKCRIHSIQGRFGSYIGPESSVCDTYAAPLCKYG